MTQLALPLPAPTPYVCDPRELALLDWLFYRGPHPDDVAEQEARLADARAVAARHRREVNALSGRR